MSHLGTIHHPVSFIVFLEMQNAIATYYLLLHVSSTQLLAFGEDCKNISFHCFPAPLQGAKLYKLKTKI